MSWYYLVLLAVVVAGERKPMYKYRYETEDFMKTAASSVPVHGYHVVEGGYYPDGAGFGVSRYSSPGIGGYGPSFGSYGGYGPDFGGYGPSYGGYGSGFAGYEAPGYFGPSYGGHHHYPSVHGKEYVDRSSYGGGKKQHSDGKFEKAGGNAHEEAHNAQEGYNAGNVAVKDNKGDSGYYADEHGGKKASEEGKQYHGAQHYNQEGKNADEKNQKSGHKKGHKIKGFKTSHHKDESGKTEEYFDEANDEGGNYNYEGKSGGFGENKGSSFKGGHENNHFDADKAAKQGHYESHHSLGKDNGDKGSYGQKKYYGNEKVYGVNNGFDEHSLLGHQENSRFYKHHPYHVPFYHQH